MEKQTAIKLIELYEAIIHGGKGRYGLLDCYDTYYAGCWDNDFSEVDKLKIQLGIKPEPTEERKWKKQN